MSTIVLDNGETDKLDFSLELMGNGNDDGSVNK